MGSQLWDRFPDFATQASDHLGYSVVDLCEGDGQRLTQTQFAQPAIYTVSVLHYLDHLERSPAPDFVAGHSVGEYAALFAAGAYDFVTGLRLVAERGRLMSRVTNGGMAAVIGLAPDDVRRLVAERLTPGVEVANYNAPDQVVVSGDRDRIEAAEAVFREAGCAVYIPLRVSGAFHSSSMDPARRAFESVLADMRFTPTRVPVISNLEARPADWERLPDILARQLTSPVRWQESMEFLLAEGVTDFVELGPGNVLQGLLKKIKAHAPAVPVGSASGHARSTGSAAVGVLEPPPGASSNGGADRAPISNGRPPAAHGGARSVDGRAGIVAESLGSAAFRQEYGLKYAYLSGAMYKGIASADLVIEMGKAGLMGFLGTGGLSLERIEADLQRIQAELPAGKAYGMNLLCNLVQPELEDVTVDLYLRHGVRTVEASAYMTITPSVVRYRLHGIHRVADGRVVVPNRVIAKVSRPEIAAAFMSPPPKHILDKLLDAGRITPLEAELGAEVPVACDLCLEADSGGHTDQGVAYALMPAILRLRDDMMARYRYARPIHIGAAGGIGTPTAVAAAFTLGADFVLTGSVNQCTVEAGMSDEVKDMLQTINIQDTAYAPAGDMFELGAKVQVLKRGTFFAARGNQLYDIYTRYDSIEDIDPSTRRRIEEKYFRRSFDAVWEETRDYYARNRPDVLAKAEGNPKVKMSLLFRWYFIHTMRLALAGSEESRVDYQVHTGPALGAFNQWAKGTDLESWRNRHVVDIAERLMGGAADTLNERFAAWCGA